MLFHCLKCRKKLRGKPEWRGRKVRCPSCNLVFVLPAATAAGKSQKLDLMQLVMSRSRN